MPPTGWQAEPVIIGRYGYKADPGSEVSTTGVYTGFKVNAYYPTVNQGIATLTYDDLVVSRYVSAKVPKAKPRCGDWGYAIGDVDKNCRVDLRDFAYQAMKWLGCTEPDGAECIPEGIVGAGFAFDGGDTDGPARILYLYNDLNAGVLEANDIILEYRGAQISDGNELHTTMLAMDDVEAGETMSMVIERDSIQFAVEPQVDLQWAGQSFGYETPNARCVYKWETSYQSPVAAKMCRCEADPNVEWCRQQWYIQPYDASYKVGSIGGWCVDSTGSTGGEPRGYGRVKLGAGLWRSRIYSDW